MRSKLTTLSLFFDSKILNNMVQELPVETMRAGGVHLSTTLRNGDPFKGLKFCILCKSSACLAGCPQDATLVCLSAKESFRLLEAFLNRRVVLVGKSSEFGENYKKWCLQIWSPAGGALERSISIPWSPWETCQMYLVMITDALFTVHSDLSQQLQQKIAKPSSCWEH